MSKFDNIETSNKMDKVISDAIKQGKKIKAKKKKKVLLVASAASLLLISGATVVGVKNPSFAEKLPIIGDMVDLIQNSMQAGNLTDSYTDVNKSYTKNGLTIAVERVVYSKNQMYMELELKTDKPFDESEYKDIISPVKSTDKNPTNKYLNMVNPVFWINNKKVESYGFDAPEFNYVDDYTLKGTMLIDFKSPIKENNTYDIFKMEFGLEAFVGYDGDKNKYEYIKPIDGIWTLEFPVKSNKEKTKEIKVNKKQDNITVKEVTLSQTSLNIILSSKKSSIIEGVEVKDDSGKFLNGAGVATSDGDKYDGDYHLNSINQDMESITVVVYTLNTEDQNKKEVKEIKVDLK